MADVVGKQTRSQMMSSIKGTNTRPEMMLRRALHMRGYRFRIHDRRLPGRPDIVLPKWRVVIEVRGCFWHRHKGCPKASIPTTNVGFWQEKFNSNVARDLRNVEALLNEGWRVLVVWECAIGRALKEHLIDQVTAFVTVGLDQNENQFLEIGTVRLVPLTDANRA